MIEPLTGDYEADLSKDAFEALVPDLRLRLIQAQQHLADTNRNVVIMLDGNDRPEINRTLTTLREWMDPRGLDVHTLDADRALWTDHPGCWRYWRLQPAFGRIGIFYHNWVQDAYEDAIDGRTDSAGFALALEHCCQFERQLAQDHTHLVKFHLRLSAKAAERRERKAKKRPDKYYRYHHSDAELVKRHAEGAHHIDTALEVTAADYAPWHLIGTDQKRRMLVAIAETIITTLERAVRGTPAHSARYEPIDIPPLIDGIDLTTTIDEKDYRNRLRDAQMALNRLTFEAEKRGQSTVLVFEGVDAAGKGGAIRRLCSAISAEHYEIIPIAAPTPDEINHHYLWRFWKEIPGPGDMKIFDRSWYGRVLVERVEGYCSEYDWQRAYNEMNEFEQQLTDHGIIVCKFWLHIDQDEQLNRFQAREETPFKRFKITDEDYRNRKKWPRYETAINEMLHRTNTATAPWHLIPANDKHSARVQVLETIQQALSAKLD